MLSLCSLDSGQHPRGSLACGRISPGFAFTICPLNGLTSLFFKVSQVQPRLLILVTQAKNLFPNSPFTGCWAGVLRTWAYLLGGTQFTENSGNPQEQGKMR